MEGRITYLLYYSHLWCEIAAWDETMIANFVTFTHATCYTHEITVIINIISVF